MNSELKPIETIYNGYRFRSRLEARWAVFFDALKIKWEYEPEGYVLSNGEKYLPDFYLPTFNGGMYVEVKPDGGDFSKAIMFAKDALTLVWLAEGMPDLKEYSIAESNCLITGIPNFDQSFCENRMFVSPGYCDKETGRIPASILECESSFALLNAVKQARSARFEFGENDWVR